MTLIRIIWCKLTDKLRANMHRLTLGEPVNIFPYDTELALNATSFRTKLRSIRRTRMPAFPFSTKCENERRVFIVHCFVNRHIKTVESCLKDSAVYKCSVIGIG